MLWNKFWAQFNIYEAKAPVSLLIGYPSYTIFRRNKEGNFDDKSRQ